MKKVSKMSKVLSILLVFLMTISFSACSNDNSTNQNTSSNGNNAENEEVKLLLWLTGPLFEDYLKEVIPKFEEQNPGIKVEYETIDWGSYEQKILTAVGGGIAPDVVSIFTTNTAPFADKGVFTPLDEYVDTSAFVPNYLAGGQWDGKQYTLPIAMTVRPLYYRSDLLAEAGYDAPPETWEEFREVAKALTKRNDKGNIERVGFWVPTNHPFKTIQVWLAFLQNNGGQVFDEQGNPVFNSQAGIEAAQLFHDLVQVDKVDVPGTIQTDDKDLMQGKVAMLLSNSAIRGLSEEFKENVSVALPPYNKVPVVEASGEAIGITSTCKHPEAAAKLVEYLTTDVEASVLYAKLEGAIPPTLEAQKHEYVTSNPMLLQMQEMANEYGVPLPNHPQWVEISATITSALDSIIIDGVSAEKALNEAAEKVESLIK